MQAKDIKPGAVVNYQGAPVIIESVAVQTPSARGAATLYKYRGRNLVTRQKSDLALKGGESLDEADFQGGTDFLAAALAPDPPGQAPTLRRSSGPSHFASASKRRPASRFRVVLSRSWQNLSYLPPVPRDIAGSS